MTVNVQALAKEIIGQMAIENVGPDLALQAAEWQRIQSTPALNAELWYRVKVAAGERANKEREAARKKA